MRTITALGSQLATRLHKPDFLQIDDVAVLSHHVYLAAIIGFAAFGVVVGAVWFWYSRSKDEVDDGKIGLILEDDGQDEVCREDSPLRGEVLEDVQSKGEDVQFKVDDTVDDHSTKASSKASMQGTPAVDKPGWPDFVLPQIVFQATFARFEAAGVKFTYQAGGFFGSSPKFPDLQIECAKLDPTADARYLPNVQDLLYRRLHIQALNSSLDKIEVTDIHGNVVCIASGSVAGALAGVSGKSESPTGKSVVNWAVIRRWGKRDTDAPRLSIYCRKNTGLSMVGFLCPQAETLNGNGGAGLMVTAPTGGDVFMAICGTFGAEFRKLTPVVFHSPAPPGSAQPSQQAWATSSGNSGFVLAVPQDIDPAFVTVISICAFQIANCSGPKTAAAAHCPIDEGGEVA